LLHSYGRLGSRQSRRPGYRSRIAKPIDREPRGTPEYEAKVAALAISAPDRFQTLELAEESILSDRKRIHARRALADGTTFDLTAYDEFNALFSFREKPDGTPEFIDFRFYERPT
jgi:hypothetical protein